MRVRFLVVSDTCFQGKNEDKSGPSLVEAVSSTFPDSQFVYKAVIPDDIPQIATMLKHLSSKGVHLVLTTGGTGVSKRDVTPEATKSVIDKEIPGIPQAILMKSLTVTDMAMISRAIAGVRGNTLIINLPGSSKAALECFNFVKSVIPHAIQLILDHKEEIEKVHDEVQGNDDGKDKEESSDSAITSKVSNNKYL